MHRTAAGAIGTDHHLLRAKVKIHLRSRRKNQQPKRKRLDFKKLHDIKLVDAFQKDIDEMRKEAANDTMTIDEKYANFVEYVKKTGYGHFQQEQNNHRKQKEWLTDEILDIVNKRAKAFLDWQNNRGKRLEQKHRDKYRMLRKLAKTKIDARQQGSNQADFLLAWPAHVRPAPFVACLCLLYIFFGLACLPVIFSGLPGLPVSACLNFYISIKMLISHK